MSSIQPQSQKRSLPKKLRRALLATTLIASPLLYGMPVMAAPAGEIIQNKATGSFIDTDNTEKAIESNIVQVTVAEIAGVTVTATGTSGAPNPGQTVYFNYTIKNFGNDPTQFFIPALGTLTGNATQPSNIQITGYSIDGISLTDLSASPITVPNGGGQTGRNSVGTAGFLKTPNPNGEFQPNGYITVRIPVLINSTGVSIGDTVTAQLGDTPVDSASTATPKARQQNIAYNNSNTVTNRVYTVDNADALNVTNEATGFPFNGDTTNHRQEASATQSVNAISASPQPFVCNSNIYMTKGSAGANGLFQVLISGSSVSFSPLIGTLSSGVNAIAFREADGYIYAMNTSNSHLIRIDANGVRTDLGAVTNLPAVYYNAGDFGPDGYYYVQSIAGGALEKIDIATRTRVSQGGTTTINVSDFAIHRTDGFAYGVLNFGQAVRIPVAGGAGVPFGPIHNKVFGAVYSDALGNVYLSENATNDIYQLDIVTGNITKVADFNPDLTTGANDGAFCKSATFPAPPIDRSDAPISGTAPNGTGTNSYGEAVHVIVSGIQLGAVIDRDMGSIADATASGDGPDDDGISSFSTLTAGATSYSIPAANVSATGTGTLHAWIDFNQDGLFSATEYSSVSVTNGTLSGPLNWSGMVIGSSGQTFVRLRFTSAALTDDTATTNTDERAVGFANDGEVEDYQVTIAANTYVNVLLVKRITAINGNTTNGTVSLNSYDPDSLYPYDKNVIVMGLTPPTTDKWPNTSGNPLSSTFLLGARDGGIIKFGDEVEYTIYFLSAGTAAAKTVQLCDRVPEHQTFVPNAYNFITPGAGVAPTVNADRGIALSYQGSLKSYTNLADGDIAQYYPPGQVPLPNVCKTVANPNVNSNPTGAVVINLGAAATATTAGDLPSASDPASANTSYGFVRFKVKNTTP
jgi:uncharacterized repeat protein (TIGR01451 family)